jgi:hypothetical protein
MDRCTCGGQIVWEDAEYSAPGIKTRPAGYSCEVCGKKYCGRCSRMPVETVDGMCYRCAEKIEIELYP